MKNKVTFGGNGYEKKVYLNSSEFYALSDEAKKDYYESLAEERKAAVTAEEMNRIGAAYAAMGSYRGAADFARELRGNAEKQKASDDEYNLARRKKGIIILSIIVAVVAVATVFITVLSMSNDKAERYAQAKQLYNEGKYNEALEIFEDLGEYDDAPLYVLDIKGKNSAGTVNGQRASRGDTVNFGVWEQDGDASNGKEAIDWLVIDYDDKNKRVLLLSVDILHSSAFGSSSNWKQSEILTWLNGDFIDGAFTSAEKAFLITNLFEELDEEGNVISASSSKLTLPSAEDCEDYISDILDRKAEGAGENEWWLRTAADEDGKVLYVTDNGRIAELGAEASESYGVRPMMWVKLKYN